MTKKPLPPKLEAIRAKYSSGVPDSEIEQTADYLTDLLKYRRENPFL